MAWGHPKFPAVPWDFVSSIPVHILFNKRSYLIMYGSYATKCGPSIIMDEPYVIILLSAAQYCSVLLSNANTEQYHLILSRTE